MISFHRFLLPFIAIALSASAAEPPSNFGRHYPSEMRTIVDKITGLPLVVLTTDPANDSKPYQTHTTWTADGQWIIFRSNRGGHGSQAFLVNETKGDIIQLTDGPATGTGSLNLSRHAMKLYYMRGGRTYRRPGSDEPASPPTPHQLVELDLGQLIPDSLAGAVKAPADYERIVAALPDDLRDSGGFALDADESCAYWGVAFGPPPALSSSRGPERPAGPAGRNRIDSDNTDPAARREAARERFATLGRGPGGIRRIDLKTGAITKVIDVDFRMGHVQTNPWVPGEIIYCHETTGDAPQRMWTVHGDGSGNRPLYVETPDEWITHETVSAPDEVMFSIMGHLPYLREHPTGIAVIDLRTNRMKLLGQVEEAMPNGGTGGFWHCNGSPDGRWAVGDTFRGSIYVISRATGQRVLLTTGHPMRPDHTHPIFSPDSRRVLIQSGLLTDGKSLDLMEVAVPEGS